MTAAEQLAAYIRGLADFKRVDKVGLPYGHMGATITDAILQAGVRYETVVVPKVRHVMEAFPNDVTSSDFLALLNGRGENEVVCWPHAEKLGRIRALTELLVSEGVETEGNLRDWLCGDPASCEGHIAKLRAVRGIGPKTVDYLKLLCGEQTACPVDVHLLRFLALAGVPARNYEHARATIVATAPLLDMSPAQLDHSIWTYMSEDRGRRSVNVPQTTAPSVVIGYDPGGNECHGVAEFQLEDGRVTSAQTWTLSTAEKVIAFLEQMPPIAALGVDTLSCWSTGPSGWRPADRWLRQQYPGVRNSVVNPNGLFGSMGLNGMAVLLWARRTCPDLLITETHPKVLHFQMTGRTYDYVGDRVAMDAVLGDILGVELSPANDHEWDAALSAYAALEGLTGRWTRDLLQLPTQDGERLISPCEATHYFWPV